MEFKSEESVFNMALAYLKRIDTLLYFCQEAALKQDKEKWLGYLRAIYRETSVKLKDDEKKEILGDPNEKIDLETLTDKFIEEEEANFKNIYFLMNNPELRTRYEQIILFLLDALDVKLRGKLQKKGMLLPSREDPRFAILKR